MIYFFAIIIFIILLYISNEIYFHVVLRNNQEQEIYHGKNGNYDIVSFGSTYCRYGIEFPENVNGFNFGFTGQFLYYTDKMLREYTPKCLTPGGTVCLIIADLVFAEVGKGLYDADRYPLILSKKSLEDEYSFIVYAQKRYPLFFRPFLMSEIIKYFVKLIFKKDKSVFYTLLSNPLSEEKVKIEAQKRCESWCRQFGLENTCSVNFPNSLKENFTKTTRILNGMIQFCLDNHFKPVLVILPVSGIMNEFLSTAFIRAILFDNILKANVQKVRILNYIDDKRFSNYLLYHKNADFLNARGRKLFTEQLLKDLETNENWNFNIS